MAPHQKLHLSLIVFSFLSEFSFSKKILLVLFLADGQPKSFLQEIIGEIKQVVSILILKSMDRTRIAFYGVEENMRKLASGNELYRVNYSVRWIRVLMDFLVVLRIKR